LRNWLGLDPEVFYDPARVAIVPAGMCYPGVAPSGGDNPPRPECAPLWHPLILPLLRDVRLTVLVGAYAQKLFLGSARSKTLTQTVADFAGYLPAYLPLPHPSWRSLVWERKNPWFMDKVLPAARLAILQALW
jgi:uracil-DNA glycosylase